MSPPTAPASRTRTGGKHAAQRRRPDRERPAGRRLVRLWLVRLWPAGRRPGLEIGGLAVGLAAGLGIALGLLSPASPRHPAAPATARQPLVVPGVPAPDPAALDAEWAAYSDRSRCADWAGGDGVSAIRLNSSQLAWFFSDTYLGPAGPDTGFSHISGFVNNSVVIQTTAGRASSFVTLTGGGACSGPARPGQASQGQATPVVAPPAAPGGATDRYWDEDGITVGRTVVKFYNRYLAGSVPFVPAGTVIATFGVSQLSSAGHGPAYGAVARPALVPLPSWIPPGGTSPVIWGAALLQAGSTVYVYGTQSSQGQGAQGGSRQLYLARVPASRLTTFSAWRFYAGPGRWAAGQQDARPVPPPGGGVSSGFSVVAVAGRYWLIQAGPEPGSQDIDAYPASEPWGPFGPGVLLYRNPAIGLDAAHDYRIMYEARAEPALSARGSLVISYNVNSEAVTTGCVPMSAFTNTVTQPRFITVPLAAFGPGQDLGTAAVRAAGAAPDYPRVVSRHPSQWFSSWSYPNGCPPVPGLAAGTVHARPGAGKVTLSWPDAGLGVRYQVYLQGPVDIPAVTEYGTSATMTGLRSGSYLARVVPVNTRQAGGTSAETTFVVP
jgi:hypothetical protein